MSGSSKQTTTASSEPWSGAQPALKTGIANATNLFNSGVGSKVYTGSTVTPWSSQTTSGMNAMEAAARANMGGRGLSGMYQGVIKNGGYNSDMQTAANGFRSMASGNGLNSSQNAALANTQQLANSNFDVNANPAFQQVLQQAQRGATDAVSNSAAAAGRYGSGVFQGNLAREVGDLTSRMVGNEYQNWQNRRDTANQNLFSMGQQGQNNLASARSSLAGLGQQAFSNLGAAYQGMNAPVQDLFKVGSMNEDLANRVMNDKLRIFDSTQNKPWENLARFNAIASGAGQLGGTQTNTQPGQNPFLAGLGALSGGLGLLGSFF